MCLITQPWQILFALFRLRRWKVCPWLSVIGLLVVSLCLVSYNWQTIKSLNGQDTPKYKFNDSDFQPVEVNASYVYSAYIDDRPAPDVDSKALPVVRIFAVLPRKSTGQARRSWKCIFWSETFGQSMVSPVIGLTDLNTFDRRSRLMSAMVLCSLPTHTQGTDPPYGVSLASNVSHIPQNHLRLVDLRTRKGFEENLLGKRDKNNDDTSFSRSVSNFTISNFTICIPPLFGNDLTSMEIIEFIELNRILGADKFVFYMESPSHDAASCLHSRSWKDIVEIVTWDRPSALHEMHNHGQILAQNDCLFRVMYRTKYVINQDLDEFIVPTQTTDWTTMLDSIHKNMRPGQKDRAASYNFRNLFFPLDASNDLSLTQPFRVKDYELKTLTKTTCLDKLNPWKQRSKVMGRPERLLIWHVHEILDSSLVRKGDVNAMVNGGHGLLFHYRKLGPEHSNKTTTNRRIWRYQRQLFASVASRATSSDCRPRT